MEIDKKSQDNIVIFYLRGEIDFIKAPELKTRLNKEIDEHGYTHIIINMEDLTYLDSSGIGELIGIVRKMRDKGIIRLCSLQKSIYNVLRLTGLISLFQIDETEEESMSKIIKE